MLHFNPRAHSDFAGSSLGDRLFELQVVLERVLEADGEGCAVGRHREGRASVRDRVERAVGGRRAKETLKDFTQCESQLRPQPALQGAVVLRAAE